MRILYCVQRYGEEVGGGAEAACRMFAERMSAGGHSVEVVTSCARDYTTWADFYDPGVSELNGVTVNRLPLAVERRPEQFGPLSARVLGGGASAALAVERDWLRTQGPEIKGLEAWLDANAARFDLAVFYTYLYSPSAIGLPVAARHTATLLHPAAHDEPMIDLRCFDPEFYGADGLSVHTPEEAATVRSRAGARLMDVIGLGIEINPPPADGNRFRSEFGFGDEPLMLYVGRVEPGKGTDELARFFLRSKERLHHFFKLVMVGPVVHPPPEHPDIVTTGFVDEQTRRDAYSTAHTFVLPSYFESFSIALCDAWVVRRPALVNANCSVLAGQAARSGGGLGYRNYAEFEQAFLRILAEPELCAAMGEAGRTYVTSQYDWPVVLERYERLLAATVERHRARREAAEGHLDNGIVGA